MFIYFEKESKQVKGREREGDTESKAVSMLELQHRAQHGAETHELRDHDLRRSQTLNGLSRPSAPFKLSLLKTSCTRVSSQRSFQNPSPIQGEPRGVSRQVKEQRCNKSI